MNRPTLLFILLPAGAVLLAPIAIYIWHFGWSISSDHTQWAEMGSAMAGIYAPLLGLLTLTILWKQHQTLRSQHLLQERQQIFLQDQHIQNNCRENLNGALRALKERMSEQDCTRAIRAYSRLSPEDTVKELLHGTGPGIPERDLTSLWVATYNCFTSFKKPDAPLSYWFYSSMREKVMIEIGMNNCKTLDKIALLERSPIIDFEYFTNLKESLARHFPSEQESGPILQTPASPGSP